MKAREYLRKLLNLSGLRKRKRDLVHVFAGTALMQTGQAVEILAITMSVYLALSLTISLLMNWYNSAMALKDR